MLKASLVIGRVGGTEIRLHWTMLFIIPYVLTTFRPADLSGGLRAFLVVGLIFVCVLLHELGHTFVARLHGIRVPSVVLYPLGGAAMTEREAEKPLGDLLIAAAGPLVNLLLASILLIVMAALGMLTLAAPPLRLPGGFWMRSVGFMAVTNLILAVTNLLPIYPLDGGRIFKALMQMIFGPVRSSLVTFWLSFVLGLGVLAWSVFARSWLLAFTALLLIAGAATLNQQVVVGAMRFYAGLTRRPDLYTRILDYDPAVKLLSEMIDENPKDGDLYLQRAYIYYFMDDFLRAMADVDRALALYPYHLQAILLRGALFYAQDYPAGSWECVERSEQIRPGWSVVWLNRSILHRDDGHLDTAMGDIQQAFQQAALEREKVSPVILYLVRSSISFRQGARDAACADWEQAYRISPRETTVFSVDRARIFAKDWDWVVGFFAWAEEKTNHSPLIAVVRGEVALRAGHNEQAVADFTQAMERYTSFSDLSFYRGQAYQSMGDLERAAEDFRKAIKTSPRAHIRRMATTKLKSLTGSV